jgi:hypothetical protein
MLFIYIARKYFQMHMVAANVVNKQLPTRDGPPRHYKNWHIREDFGLTERTRWAGAVVRMRERRYAYKNQVERTWGRWQDNTKWDLEAKYVRV